VLNVGISASEGVGGTPWQIEFGVDSRIGVRVGDDEGRFSW
jgi:hypothetical protein